MEPVHVLVVFYSRHGTAERLALAAALGAIQAEALIRLRRVADGAEPAAIEADPAWQAQVARMHRDYVEPRPADPAWADVIVLAAPGAASTEVERYCDALRGGAGVSGKLAAVLAPGNTDAALRPIYAAAACAGLVVVPGQLDDADPVESATGFGRRVVEMARALRQAAPRLPAQPAP
jgi:NAD(P)H dehydrogenase (quinone)